MKTIKHKLFYYAVNILAAGMFLLCYCHQLAAQDPVYPNHPTGKKLIVLQAYQYLDWSPELATNLTTMQTDRPYVDGVCFHNGPYDYLPRMMFNDEVWTTTSLRFDELETIATKWTTFTDNFILIWGHSRNVDPDFFNDELWSKIIANAELLGEAVAIAGCKGIMFDPEFYSGGETYSPWWYTVPSGHTHVGEPPYVANGYTFEQANAKARQRGKEFIQALQLHMPHITLMTTFLYEYIWEYCYGDINNLSGSHYALLSGFADGMLEGLNPGSVLVDGNETSYYYSSTPAFDNDVSREQSYPYLRLTGIPSVCDPALLSKWNLQGQIAMAPYIDYYLNASNATNRNNWIKNNVYYGLLTTDKYTWMYIEELNFWTGEGAPTNADVFGSISSASTLFKSGSALGFDMMSNTSWISEPSVTITSSDNNTPGDITIDATVDPPTSISKVEFYANSQKIGEDATSPYSHTASFLSADYTIYARAIKTDGTHNTSEPKILIAAGGTPDKQTPSVPTGLAFSDISEASFTLSWAASIDDVGVTGYNVLKNGVSVDTTTETSMTITGLTCATAYSMTVKARDAAGNWSAPGEPKSVTTSICPPTVIITARGENTVQGETKDKAYNDTLTDKWTDPCDTTWIQFEFSRAMVYTSYTLTSAPNLPERDPKDWEFKGSNDGTTWETLSSKTNQYFDTRTLTKTYTFINPNAYKYYKLVVSANNGDPDYTQLAEISFAPDKQAPSVPTGFASSDISETSFTLSWTASTDNVGVTGYNVLKDGVSVDTTTATSMTITGLTCATAYSMMVKARDAAGNWSAPSEPKSVTTSMCPSTVIITARGDNPSWGETKDKAYNGILTDKWTDPCDTTWIQFEFSSARVYTSYTLTSAPNLPERDPKDWEFKGSNDGTTWETLSSKSNQYFNARGLSITYAFTNTTAYKYYKLVVSANNGDPGYTQLAEISFAFDTIAPSVPEGLTFSDISETSFTLSWTASTDNLGVIGYNVLRDGVSVDTTAATSMSIIGLTCETAYSMTVKARDAAGNWSPPGEPKSVTTSMCPSTTIISAQKELKEINVYPNPGSSKITVSNIPVNSNIVMFTMDGMIVSKIIKCDKDVNFDISSWRKGIYFLQIQSENGILLKKVIIE